MTCRALNRGTGGDTWAHSTGWNMGVPYCQWHGIGCDSQHHISILSLRGFNLIGDLPPQTGYLTNLEVLNLWSNHLTGIPEEIGNLAHLRRLWLGGNELTSIPSEIGHLTDLRVLDLALNSISSLPPEIGQLGQLQTLNLFQNQISSISPEIFDLTNLEDLDISGNQLEGPIPPEIGNLDHLERLVLANNQFAGPIPAAALMNLNQLSVLDLDGNGGLFWENQEELDWARSLFSYSGTTRICNGSSDECAD